MKKETLKNIFYFLENEENRMVPFLWKWLNNEPLTEDDLHINGDLDLTYSNIESLPEGLNVSGDLILTFCENISSLPEGLIVRVNLIVEDCSQLYSLPKGLKVGGTLYIGTSPLGEYSEGELRNMVGDDGYLKRIHYL
jgi:hypothetical protein